jgi:5-formyltetrahydrofolate cyclo-ligase
MNNEQQTMTKEQLRLILRKVLSCDMSDEQQQEKSKKACQNLVSTPEFQDASAIMMYLAIPDEADVTDAIISAWREDKTVIVPKVFWKQKSMIPVRIESLEMVPIESAVSGLRNPANGVPVGVEEIDLVIAPGLGFDTKGNRLGRGGAYYDRFFADKKLKAKKCGFAFAEQVVDSVPTTDTDQKIDFLVTDEQIMYFKNNV